MWSPDSYFQQQPGFHWFFLSIFFFLKNSESLVEAEIILDKTLPFTFWWPCCLYPIAPTRSQPCLGICLKLSQLFLRCGFFLSRSFTIPARWSPHHGSLHRRRRRGRRLPIKSCFIEQKEIWLCRSKVSRLPARSCFKQKATESASALQARLSGHSGGVTAVFSQKPPIFILKNYPILSLITSPLCMVCRVKYATNTHFSVNPAVSEDANFTAIEGNLYLFPTCVHVLCLSATWRGWSFNHSLNVVTRPLPRARGQAELELYIISELEAACLRGNPSTAGGLKCRFSPVQQYRPALNTWQDCAGR